MAKFILVTPIKDLGGTYPMRESTYLSTKHKMGKKINIFKKKEETKSVKKDKLGWITRIDYYSRCS